MQNIKKNIPKIRIAYYSGPSYYMPRISTFGAKAIFPNKLAKLPKIPDNIGNINVDTIIK